MKTLIFRNAAGTNFVEYKVDIFATNGEMLTPGFDAKCTAMDIVDRSDAEIVLGMNVEKDETSWQELISFATANANFGLYVIDLNEVSYQEDTVTVAGTSGTANITIKGVDYLATFNSDLDTTVSDFVAAHQDALLLDGVLIEQVGSTAVLRVRSLDNSDSWTTAAANATGDLAGTIANVKVQGVTSTEMEIVAGA